MSIYRDDRIIENIRKGGSDQRKCLELLYNQSLPLIISFITKNNGTEADARDVFQDALVIFYEQVKSGNYVRTSRISTYLYSITRNLWLNQLKRKGREFDYRESRGKSAEIKTPLVRVLENENKIIIEDLLENLREDYRKVLKYSIFDKLSMKEIAKLMAYQNEQVARNKKYKGLIHLKKMVRESPYFSSLTAELAEV